MPYQIFPTMQRHRYITYSTVKSPWLSSCNNLFAIIVVPYNLQVCYGVEICMNYE